MFVFSCVGAKCENAVGIPSIKKTIHTIHKSDKILKIIKTQQFILKQKLSTVEKLMLSLV